MLNPHDKSENIGGVFLGIPLGLEAAIRQSEKLNTSGVHPDTLNLEP